MPRLSLLRHAKSSWDDSVPRDFDRPLNGKGRKAATVMGGFMAREKLAFDLVLASPAQRVRQTVQGIEDGLGRPIGAVFDARLYMAGAESLAELVGAIPDTVGSALLVGHNPGLEELVLWLVPRGDDRRGVIANKYPTAALAELELPGGWAEVREGAASLTRFTRPRDLDPTLGPDPE